MHNFKKALRSTGIFLLIVALISIGFMEVYFQGENFYYQDGKERKALSGSLNYYICGASHGLRAFRPDILDDQLEVNSYNLSGSRMTMKGRYEILKMELERNPADTVVLEISYDSMTRNRKEEGPEGDIYVLGRLTNVPQRLSFFFTSCYLWEYPEMYYDTLIRGMEKTVDLFRGRYQSTQSKCYKGYYPYSEENQEIIIDYSEMYNIAELDTDIYEYNLLYLNKILDLCEEHGTRVILVTVPLSKVANCEYSNLDVFYDWYCDLASERGIEYYDFNLLKEKDTLFPDESAFYDEVHLNNTGAETFSNIYCELIQAVDAGEDINELFYQSYQELDTNESYSN